MILISIVKPACSLTNGRDPSSDRPLLPAGERLVPEWFPSEQSAL